MSENTPLGVKLFSIFYLVSGTLQVLLYILGAEERGLFLYVLLGGLQLVIIGVSYGLYKLNPRAYAVVKQLIAVQIVFSVLDLNIISFVLGSLLYVYIRYVERAYLETDIS
jgi:VIT1/CCC1 family predicted Fe2+/Mn2+ transporter